jgi:carboxyl-terminal processing protease
MVEAIKGVGTRDLPLAYADLLLRGKPGETVEITVLTMRHPEPRKITLTREVIEYPPVRRKMLADETGYVQAESLVPGRAQEIARALTELQKQGAKRLVLDLRHCTVGPPEEGAVVANLFLDNGLLTYLQGQRVARKDFEADPAKIVSRLPLVVITNRGTAGAAEVAAAALLDRKRAEVVGERTYGDAAVRRTINVDDGGAIILSVAKYYSPSGKAIQDTGVTPSFLVGESEPTGELEEEAPPARPETAPTPGEDNLLKKAIEVLHQKVAQAQGVQSK